MSSYPIRVFNALLDGHKTFLYHSTHPIIIALFLVNIPFFLGIFFLRDTLFSHSTDLIIAKYCINRVIYIVYPTDEGGNSYPWLFVV